MSSRDDERFRPRPGSPKSRGAGRAPRLVGKVLRQLAATSAEVTAARQASVASTFGRGRVAVGLSRPADTRARRVIIKSRFVVLRKAGAGAVAAHLRYIVRDGVTRDGAASQAYGPEVDGVDIKAFEADSKGDRHQFRFIVSVEDAEQLEDLRSYTRELLRQVATDLETRLDWVAVDHWDTDNPHTHIVLRGRATGGEDLVIAPHYIAHGMRRRASELATRWLGPRTELEIRQHLQREVTQERLTTLDRGLVRQASGGVVDLGRISDDRAYRMALQGRLQHLETMGLAAHADEQRWRLSPRLEQTLIALGERGDILRTMQKALHGQPREYVVPAAEPTVPVTGRIAGKGLADELHERAYLVVDGIDGRARYVPLRAGADLQQFPLDGIVRVRAAANPRTSDQIVASLAREGVYRSEHHLELLRRLDSSGRDPVAALQGYVRRLEALRRAGIVERLGEGQWRVPGDLVERGRQYDDARVGTLSVELQSHLPLERQVRAVGATWLDRQLVEHGEIIGAGGFGGEVRDAIRQRVDFLASEGLAQRRGHRVVLARNLLATLRRRDLAAAAKAIAAETGLAHRALTEGESATGIYRRSVLLASGRFAMLDDGMGFSLIPWRPVIEPRLGQSMTAMIGVGSASWHFGRSRGASIA